MPLLCSSFPSCLIIIRWLNSLFASTLLCSFHRHTQLYLKREHYSLSTTDRGRRAPKKMIIGQFFNSSRENWLQFFMKYGCVMLCVLRSRWINSKRTSAVWSEVECLLRCYKSKFMSNEWKGREQTTFYFIALKIRYTSWHRNFDNFTREVRYNANMKNAR